MKIHQALILTSIPVLLGAFTLISSNQTNAANSLNIIAQTSTTTNQRPEGHKHHRRDFTEAATKLGVTEAQLKEALGFPANYPKPDFTAAATKLGVTEAQLKDALGIPANLPEGQRPPRPNFTEAATKLGITEAQLKDALGFPPQRPRPNFAEAATKLGVTEAQLKDALGIRSNPPNNPQ
jgi:hypothetical protein